jgi:hypothetical protein
VQGLTHPHVASLATTPFHSASLCGNELGTLTACHFAGNVLESRVIPAVDKAWDFPATAHKKGAGEKQNSQTKHDKTMLCYV